MTCRSRFLFSPLQRGTRCQVVLMFVGMAFISGSAFSQEEATQEIDISHWVTQLGHNQYLRRETASQRLVDAGPNAIPELVGAIRNGDLEVVERAMDVITRIAMARPPQEDGGAWDSLNRLAAKASGRASSSAAAAIEEIREFRAEQAKSALSESGVFVGPDEFVVRAVSQTRVIVQIDEKWDANIESLQWLHWLRGIENARIKGPAVREDVMEMVTQIPDLKSLTIVGGEVDVQTLMPLTKMARIHALEFWYVPLSDETGDAITKMPIRSSLNLMGTGISKEKVAEMRMALPGLLIEHRQGGFLGVKCMDTFDACKISHIVSDSAAEEAGLLDGDVIIQVNEANIKRFRDLQEAINQHVPGDEVEVKYRRGEKIESVQVRLRRLQDP